MTARFAIPAFAAFGIELEYAIVRRSTLDVLPYADRLLERLSLRQGALGWCNELTAHVVEVRNVTPTPALDELAEGFQREIRAANAILAEWDARLLPTAMHPWMNPRRETVLWAHSDRDIYATYDELFDCRRHGWANIQSMHINLPFANDEQFRRLHAAVRIVLPLIPALAASSPVAEGRLTGERDHRLPVYATNASRYPIITGAVIPDTVRSAEEYKRNVLQPMYAAIAPDDPGGVLQYEWLNSRGAIPRFDRDAIEIRVADTQEHPGADVAIAQAVIFVTRGLFEERWAPLAAQEKIETWRLRALLDATMRDADEAQIADSSFLALFGIRPTPRTASDVWADLLVGAQGEWVASVEDILVQGTLARRIERALRGDATQPRLRAVYEELCDCLDQGRTFNGPGLVELTAAGAARPAPLPSARESGEEFLAQGHPMGHTSR